MSKNKKQKDKIWVYDTSHFFEFFAPTREEAEKQALEYGEERGVELTLVNIREYQEDKR